MTGRQSSVGSMTPRQRVVDALSHREPDRVPRDLGGCSITAGINITACRNLYDHLGMDERVEVQLERASLARPAESLLQRFRIDTRSVWAGENSWTIGEPDGDGTFTDAWGVVRAAHQAGGIYGVIGSPLSGEITSQTVLAHAKSWPDPTRDELIAGVDERASYLHEESDYAVVLNLPLGIFHYAQVLRGFDVWLMDLALDPALANCPHDALLEVTLVQTRRLLEAAGDCVDVVCYADDVAMSTGPLVSPRTYRRLLRPYLQSVFAAIRGQTDAKLLYHCDGDIRWLIDDLVEMGVDAVNPVQAPAGSMGDTAALKSEFGERISFWGSIDTERVLPFGTPDDVRDEI